MTPISIEKLQYPIGKFTPPQEFSTVFLSEKIGEIGAFPNQLKKEVSELTSKQLDTPYRENGWTIRQVIHHSCDSHMNCFIRIKWALTEQNPTIKQYHENLWAENHDNKTMQIESSLALLEGLHFRLSYLLSSLSNQDLEKSFIHPENGKTFSIKEIIGTYARHGNHHLAHITELKKRKGWN